jgi:type IV secretory pathway VirB10-like protein
MKLRKIPQSEGLAKGKLWGVLIFIMLITVGTIFYVTNRDQESAANNKENTDTQQDYPRDITDAGISEILLAGHKKNFESNMTVSAQAKQNIDASATTQAHYQQQEELTLKAAMQIPLTTNQVRPQSDSKEKEANQANGSKSTADTDSLPKDDPNQITKKRAFIKANSQMINSNLKNRIADYILAMGTKIPAQIDQDINSDLPGQIYGHISRDVFDSRTHNVLLLPAGSNLVGTYDSAIVYGQERLFVAWTRINLPNGQFMDLPGMGGADAKGAGLGDEVDNHYDKIFGATALISILAAGAQLAQPQQSNAWQSPGIGQTIGQSVGTQIAQTGIQLMNKNLNLQPTLHIRPGFEFTVEVNKDLVFPGKYTGNAEKLD